MAMQSRIAALRQEIERSLASRIPSALSPRAVQIARLFPIGNKAVNDLLGGGLPIGGICELTGPASAGRTSLALSVLREATVDSACAYIDVSDSLDARSTAAAGVRLTNLLWVRFSEVEEQRANSTQMDPQPGRAGIAVAVNSDRGPDRRTDYGTDRGTGPGTDRSTQHHGNRHPRTETKGIDRDLEKMLIDKAQTHNQMRLKKMEGTPGYPNQRLSLAVAPEEQVAFEHLNARHADATDPLRQIDLKAADRAHAFALERTLSRAVVQGGMKREAKPWSKLDKALRTADQILQAGGFRVVVLDLATISPEQALRIPLATWYRFSRAAQEGDAILLLLTQEPCARSSAKCVVDCSPRLTSNESSHGSNPGSSHASSHVLGSMTHAAEVLRERTANPYGKKAPGRVVVWNSTAPCMRSVGMPRTAGR